MSTQDPDRIVITKIYTIPDPEPDRTTKKRIRIFNFWKFRIRIGYGSVIIETMSNPGPMAWRYAVIPILEQDYITGGLNI